jgi:hypothetical protein
MMILPAWASRSDEMPGYVKGDSFGEGIGGSKIMKVAACPYGTRLTPREGARIREIDRSRQRADERRAAARRRERAYVVERVERPSGRCVGERYTMEGSKNVFSKVAQYNAREAWRRKVRSKHGTQYQDIDYAVQSNTRCWDEGAFTRCEFSARACRAGG